MFKLPAFEFRSTQSFCFENSKSTVGFKKLVQLQFWPHHVQSKFTEIFLSVIIKAKTQ